MNSSIVGWLLTAVIFGLLFAVGAMLYNSVLLFIKGKRVQGTVVGLDKRGELLSPIYEFETSSGEVINTKGRSYSSSPSARVGELVSVIYDRSNPKNSQLLLYKDFPIIPAGFVLSFICILLLMWISVILISDDTSLGDPFHILTKIITIFQLDPSRFPLFLILSIVIPACTGAAYITLKNSINIRSNGIKVPGHVIGFQIDETERKGNVTVVGGKYSLVAYRDLSDIEYIIKSSLTNVLSRLKIGDTVEVIYLKHSPEIGIINVWYELWPPPFFLV